MRALGQFVSHKEVVAEGLLVMSHLSVLKHNQITFDIAGSCELPIKLMQLHFENETLIHSGYDVICNLTRKNFKFIHNFGSLGACELLVKLTEFHLDNVVLVERGCDVINNLSTRLAYCNREKFGSAGACELMLKVMQHHLNQESVVHSASITIHCLLIDHNYTKILSSDCCDLFLKVIDAYVYNKNLISLLSNFLLIIAKDNTFKHQLVSLGISSIIKRALQVHTVMSKAKSKNKMLLDLFYEPFFENHISLNQVFNFVFTSLLNGNTWLIR